MANHIEVRVPFLDKNFLEVAMNVDPHWKRPQPHQTHSDGGASGVRKVEKWVIRKAFDDQIDPFIPAEILWRQKEQFSDGVGYGWIDALIAHCASRVSDVEMQQAATRFPYNPPQTKEAYHIRSMFARHFPGESAARTVLRWVPKWQANADPSGRASAFHESTTENSEKSSSINAVVNNDDDQRTGEPMLKRAKKGGGQPDAALSSPSSIEKSRENGAANNMPMDAHPPPQLIKGVKQPKPIATINGKSMMPMEGGGAKVGLGGRQMAAADGKLEKNGDGGAPRRG